MKNPIFFNPSDPYRVYRGGSWDYFASYTRVSDRDWFFVSNRFSNLGFRIFRTL